MKSKFTITVVAGLALMSTASFAASTDGVGTHKRTSVEETGSLRVDMLKPHVHRVLKTTGLYTSHEDVNPMAKDRDREIRRVDEKNERGRALR